MRNLARTILAIATVAGALICLPASAQASYGPAPVGTFYPKVTYTPPIGVWFSTTRQSFVPHLPPFHVLTGSSSQVHKASRYQIANTGPCSQSITITYLSAPGKIILGGSIGGHSHLRTGAWWVKTYPPIEYRVARSGCPS